MSWLVPPATYTTGNPLPAGDLNDIVGDLVILQTNVGLFGKGPAAAGAAPPPVTSPAYLIQAGTTVQTAAAGNIVTITFPSPFPNGLLTITGCSGDTFPGSLATVVQFANSSYTTTGANAVVSYWNGSALVGAGGQSCRVNWIAIGY